MTAILSVLSYCAALCVDVHAAEQERPNILWIIVEDMSCHFGYQGESLVQTPNVDRLASEGVVFSVHLQRQWDT